MMMQGSVGACMTHYGSPWVLLTEFVVYMSDHEVLVEARCLLLYPQQGALLLLATQRS
jgi:hypothetical protein